MKNLLFKNYKRFYILFSIAVGFLFWIQMISQASILEATIFALCIFVPMFSIAGFMSNRILPKAMKTKKVHIFIVWLVLLSLLMALFFTVVTEGFYLLEQKGVFPSSYLLNDTGSFLEEYIKAAPSMVVINFVFCGVRFFYENTLLQKANLESQLQTLQDQITPHFMFNVLNHIHVLMQSDVELASSLLIKYSDILRYQLYSGKKEQISLEQEVQFLKNFVDIEKVRWEDKLDVSCSWIVENGNKQIAPLLFITFVENAFKHASKNISEKGFVIIDFVQTTDIIRLEIKNSKSSISVKKSESSGLGLENVKKRLDILYPKNYTLSAKETDAEYFTELIIET